MPFTLHENTDVFEYMDGLEGNILFMHGCNAQGVMGAGVAKVVKQRWPKAFHAYKQLFDGVANQKLREMFVGDVQLVPVTPQLTVVNAITQHRYASRSQMPGTQHASYDAIEKVLLQLQRLLVKDGLEYDHYVTVPVGCGLGGLGWERDPFYDEPGAARLFEASPLHWQVCRL